MHEDHSDRVSKWPSESSIFSLAASLLFRPLLSVEQVGALTVGERSCNGFSFPSSVSLGIFTAAHFHGLIWEPRLSTASKIR